MNMLKYILLLCIAGFFFQIQAHAANETASLYVRLKADKNSSSAKIMQEVISSLPTATVRVVQSESRSIATEIQQGSLLEITAKNPHERNTLLATLQQHPAVLYAEPTYTYTSHSRPNDPLYDMQNYLRRIDAEGAWASISQGTNTVTVAIIDDGVSWAHEDLVAGIFRNTKETENGQDSDNNGKIDDIRGWDFVGNISVMEGFYGVFREDNNPQNLVRDHGTRVASVIGASSDNRLGMSGVGRRVRLLPLKIGSDNPNNPLLYRLPDAILYAVEQGAKVICIAAGRTASNPGAAFSQAEAEAVKFALESGCVIIASAGNDGIQSDDKVFPAHLPGVLAVGASAEDDYRSRTSNFGIKTPLFAPGELLLSAVQNNLYDDNFSGTSAAAALASGGAALLALQYPTWSPQQIIQQLRSSSVAIGGKKMPFYQGQLHLGRALQAQNLTGISFANPVQPFSIRNEANLGVENISSFQKHTLSVNLRNYLATGENLTVSLQPIGNAQLLALHPDSRPVEISRWNAGELRTVEFSVVPDIRGVYATAEDKITRQEMLLTVQGDNYYLAELVTLSVGIGTDGAEKIAITPLTQLWDSAQTAQIAIRNVGRDTVTLRNIVLSGNSGIVLENIPSFPRKIAPNTAYNLQVRLSENTVGLYQAIVSATIDRTVAPTDTTSPKSFTTAGIVVGTIRSVRLFSDETLVHFQPTTLGSSTTQTIRVRNNGIQPAVLSAQISGSAELANGVFTLENQPITIPAGVETAVSIRFTPTTTAQVRATIRLQSDNSEITCDVVGSGTLPNIRLPFFRRNGIPISQGQIFDVSALRLGDSLVISDIELVNLGSLSVAVSGIQADGIGNSELNIQPSTSFILNSGESRPLRLVLRPTVTGEKYITLKALGQFPTREFSFIVPEIHPVGLLPLLRTSPEIQRSGAIANYWLTVESASAGQVSQGILYLQNNNTTPITLTSVQFANTSEYRLTHQLPVVVPAGKDTSIIYEFRPNSEGVKNTLVTLSYQQTALQDNFTIQAFAFGARNVQIGEFPEPSGEFSRSLVFQPIVVGETSVGRTNFGLINRGITTENAAATIIGADRTDFVLTGGSGPFPLSSNSSIDFPVEFVPRTRGVKNARLRMVTQSGVAYEIQLQGTAFPPPKILTADSLNLGEQDRQDTYILALPVTGEFLTENISARISNSEVFGLRRTRDDSLSGDQSFVQFTGDTLFTDTLFITFFPLAEREYSAVLELTSGSARKQLFISGKGRAPTKPRLFTQDQIRFDTVQLGDIQTRVLGIQGYNISQDIVVSAPEHFFLLNELGREVQTLSITSRGEIDTVLTVVFRPRNIVGLIEGEISVSTGTLSENVPLYDGVAVPKPGLTIEETVIVPQTVVNDSSATNLPLIGAVLQPQSILGIAFQGDSVFQYEYNGVRYRSGDSIAIPVGSGILVQPDVKIHFLPVEEGEFYGYVAFYSRTVSGGEFNRGTAIEGTSFLPPSFTVSDTIINFGRVKLFDIVPKALAIEARRVADTLRLELARKSPVFTFVANEITLLQSYTLQLQNKSFDDNIILVCEPTDYGIFTDTLILTTGNIVRRIPLRAIGADTTTSVQEIDMYKNIVIYPSIAERSISGRISGKLGIELPELYIYNILGMQYNPETELLQQGDAIVFRLMVEQLPSGIYFLRIKVGAKWYSGKFIRK